MSADYVYWQAIRDGHSLAALTDLTYWQAMQNGSFVEIDPRDVISVGSFDPTGRDARALEVARAVAKREYERETSRGYLPTREEIEANAGLRIVMGLDVI